MSKDEELEEEKEEDPKDKGKSVLQQKLSSITVNILIIIKREEKNKKQKSFVLRPVIYI